MTKSPNLLWKLSLDLSSNNIREIPRYMQSLIYTFFKQIPKLLKELELYLGNNKLATDILNIKLFSKRPELSSS